MSKRTKVSRVDKFYQDENTLGMFDDTFDTLCWADFADRFPCDGQVHVDVRLMYAYPMLVRVWEEVLRYVNQCKLKFFHWEQTKYMNLIHYAILT